MTPFLKHVADHLRSHIGDDLSRVAVVFPNKRAGLFLNEYLVPLSAHEVAERPVIWSPQYLTISELFTTLSPLTLADPIETICRIYHLYTRLTHSRETLDFFYGWGERLLADFDDVDKNMAEVSVLFRNLAEIKQLEDGDFINERQEQVLQNFFSDFSLKENSHIREKFLELWNVLHPIYNTLNAELAASGQAYEGALYRQVIEQLQNGKIELPQHIDCYAFVGFNVLDKVEECLFSFLQSQQKALFYWDYDTFYTQKFANAEAGTFLRSNLERFPNELPAQYFDNLLKHKTIEFVSAATENAQARSIAPWLKLHLTADEKQTAVILCNETLLQPVLYSLPPEVKEANITKGYPLYHTNAYRIVEQAMKERLPEENNMAWLERTSASIQTTAQSVNTDKDPLNKTLNTEAFFQIYTALNRFRRLITEGWLTVEATTLHKLIKQVVRQMSIPFHGEPAAGLQIMGVLETRCLDFKNILMLSVNEGNIPQRVNDNSFIPYSLRREFGLTTSRHKIAVYAYYFYRLIQRAEHVRMVYNCTANNSSTGEMSRFMTQLLVETNLPIRQLALNSRQSVPVKKTMAIAKPQELTSALQKLSPSAINTYLRCQIQFFFQRIARLKTPSPKATIIEPNTLGSVFHRSAELFYLAQKDKAGGTINTAMLAPYLEAKNDALLLKYVRQAMQDEAVAYNVIVEQTVKKYLKQLIKNDTALGNFQLLATEQLKNLTLEVPLAKGTTNVVIEGTIDRLDLVTPAHTDSPTLRIVDYKTGGEPESATSLEQLFIPAPKHPHYILQTFIYSLLLCQEADFPIMPSLFFVHKAAGEAYSPAIRFEQKELTDFRPLAQPFKEKLTALIAEILNPQTAFEPTTTAAFCKSCPYYNLCYH